MPPALTKKELALCRSIASSGADPLGYSVLADPQKAMAWINITLPDDDPRKITREDVELVEAMIDEHWRDTASRLRGLASRLRALLPPEG